VIGLSDFYASTIVKVRADFGFSQFAVDPSEITSVLGIPPSDLRRKGEERIIAGKPFIVPFNNWLISSSSESKDINVHLRELLDQVLPISERFRPDWNTPSFSVLWKGTYLYAGSGPFYEPDVIHGIAQIGADLWQDIYQVDDPEHNKDAYA